MEAVAPRFVCLGLGGVAYLATQVSSDLISNQGRIGPNVGTAFGNLKDHHQLKLTPAHTRSMAAVHFVREKGERGV